MCLAADRNLAFLHHFQQRALDFRRGAVDLVRQQQVGEHGTKGCIEFSGLLVVNPRSD